MYIDIYRKYFCPVWCAILDVIINRYDNILILGDLNIDLIDPNDQGFNNLIDICEILISQI